MGVGLIVGLGLVARLSYLHEVRSAPDFARPAVDAGFHDYWARALLSGDWTPPPEAAGRDPGIRSSAYLRPPGYPWFLAAVYRLGGGSYLAPRVVQMALGLASVLLLFLLGRALFDPWSGLVAAGLMSCYWAFIFFEAELLGASLLVVLTLLIAHLLWLLAGRPAAWLAALCGGVVGAAGLVRPNALVLAPLIAGWLLWRSRPSPEGGRRWLAAALVLVGAGAAVAPVTVRNLVVSGEPVLVSANSGINLFIGNNPRADGTFVGFDSREGHFGNCWDFPAVRARLQREVGRPLGYGGVSREYSRRAMGFVREHPAAAARLLLRKLALMWGPHELTYNKVVQLERRASPTLSRLPVDFPLALATAVLGAAAVALGWGRDTEGPWADHRRRACLGVLGLIVVVYPASFLPFFAASVYRLPVIPLLLLPAGYGVVRTARLLASRPVRGVCLLAVWVGAYLVARAPLVPWSPPLGKWHYDRGRAWMTAGEPHRALEAFRAAAAADPGDYMAFNGIGAVLLDRGEVAGAVAAFRTAAELNPAYPLPHLNLGLALARQGDLEAAAAAYRELLALTPGNPNALNDLGMVLQRQGRAEEAARCYQQALEAHPGLAAAANNLAWLLATEPDPALRDGRRAVELARRALAAVGEDNPVVLDTLAAALAEAGAFAEAVATAERALARAGSEEQRAAIAARLQLYRLGTPFRKTPGGPDGD